MIARVLAVAASLALAGSAAAQTQVATMGPQTGTFNGSTRGYYFTAPADFTITGVKVLLQTNSTNTFQNFAILKFDNATPPPPFSQTTNAFQQLALGFDLAQNVFQPVNVQVSTGDVIGVYGNTMASAGLTSGANSYAGGVQQTTTIAGQSVDLFRSGMQFHLGSTSSPLGMHDVWWENSFNITRIEFEYVVGGGSPTSFCTAGTSSNGCVATISGDNHPSVSQANPCNLTVANVEGQKSGLIFYGIDNTGFTGSPWGVGGTSFLCVKAPTQRTTTQGTGGTSGACDGQLVLDWNAYQSANPGALGNPWISGATVFAQGWYRDPPAVKTTNMSDGLEMTYVP
jgi:hypothetical protein